jgi:hypothetical protein
MELNTTSLGTGILQVIYLIEKKDSALHEKKMINFM